MPCKKPVTCSDGRVFSSATEAARVVGISPSIFYAIKCGYTSRGLKWAYVSATDTPFATQTQSTQTQSTPTQSTPTQSTENVDWNKLVEKASRTIATTCRTNLEQLRKFDSKGLLTELLVSSFEYHCQMLRSALRQTKVS